MKCEGMMEYDKTDHGLEIYKGADEWNTVTSYLPSRTNNTINLTLPGWPQSFHSYEELLSTKQNH